MVGRKKKTKICDKVSHEEDRLSQLPEPLISEILCQLSTKDAVRTSVLSTRWRNLWQSVPGLDLDSGTFSTFDAFVSFADRFFYSHKESWIRKLRVNIHNSSHSKSFPIRWIDAVSTHRIQHLDVHFAFGRPEESPSLNIYVCQTLVQLRLRGATLASAEFVSLPCLKIMQLEYNSYPNEATVEKLVSGSPVLEYLTIITYFDGRRRIFQVRSHTVKRIHINECTQVVIDAPLLQCLRATVSIPKNFQFINSAFSGRLDIDISINGTRWESVICDILTNISRVRDLVISRRTWKEIFEYSKSGPVPKEHCGIFQFRNLSHLNARFYISDLETLPTLLESCPKLESLILELVKDRYMIGKKKKEPKVMFSKVPQCLVSSLKFVQWKRLISRYEGEIELVRYFLKNSKILEKFRLDTYYTEKSKCTFLQELLTMPRCSSVCEIHSSLIPKTKYG
ncbi:F-box/FBD/LRR-repeat protein At1g51370-like [Arabidopsis lyrata subsp. lyrata]|uniref:F-box/FBD/LRR-repeat protein At1g51370-like n=1 Tax=Arabidopsis lyrata subsp. lyrata TaxID=81972 RepID=UPI000A29CC8F|nr:F-box/FBD/LRR-repeat protein At1g51370-like [Arabidopsis lyrata subsp. lyrata]|eukprot:XP_020871986.1 F-box/FBD/LRR-repeat protein At1g51370-like [Arabidopsis lyrata subsp. lyrata]